MHANARHWRRQQTLGGWCTKTSMRDAFSRAKKLQLFAIRCRKNAACHTQPRSPEGAALVGVLSTLCMPSRDTLRSPEGGAASRACSGDWLGLLAIAAPLLGG